MTGSRAIVRDFFSGTEIARVMSLLMMVFGIAPIIAPSIGGIVVATLGWRAIFIVLAAIATAVLIATGRFLRESKGADPTFSLHPTNIIRQYVNVFRNRQFVTYTLASAAGMGGFFAYITGAPFVYMKLLGFTEAQFGWLYGANVLGLIVASQINRALLKKRTALDVLLGATVVHLAASIALVIVAQPRLGAVTGIVGLIFCYLFLMGFIGPNGMALALDPFTRNAASASAMMGCLQMVAGASASALVSYLHNGTALPMVAVMAGCTCLSLLVLCESALFARRQLAATRQ
jgi:DHA1 family bicyclomycin/chloramphenicol resistance-like MFS transporter